MSTTKKSSPRVATPKVEEAVEQLQPSQGQSLQEQLVQKPQPEPGEPKTVTLLRCLIDEQKTTNTLLSGIAPALSRLTATLQALPDTVLTLAKELEEIHGLILDHQEHDVDYGRDGDDDTAEDSEATESDEIEKEMLSQQRRASQPAPLTGSYTQSVLKNASWHPGEPRPVILPSPKRAGGLF